jgi:hypothetical protein
VLAPHRAKLPTIPADRAPPVPVGPNEKTARPPLKGAEPMGRKTDASSLGRTFVTGYGLRDCRRRNCRAVRLRLLRRRCSAERARFDGVHCNLGRFAAAARCSWVRSAGARYNWGAREPQAARSLENPDVRSRRRACRSAGPGYPDWPEIPAASALRASVSATERCCRRTGCRSAAIHPGCRCAERPAG